MKPQFTTQCFVQADDLGKRKELATILSNQGCSVCICLTMDTEPKDTPCFVFNTVDGSIHIVEIPDFGSDYIDCGTNTELFIALASMRSDTDKGQWFTYKPTGLIYHYLKVGHLLLTKHNGFSRSTAQEIVEYFNNKTK